MKNTFNGERYLMAIHSNGDEFVARYAADEMREIFTEDQIQKLNENRSVAVFGKNDDDATLWIDMIAAAREEF